ncbi:DnaJ-domain-containing protein [Rhizophagus clarus]|uniref:DnaJ-domain-containing protein n=1 Tax=Rhizophagus clarus TaxID=94130 RepID=A0A8H3R458_9GLOM|nr:DnaJ-domain-containing protein [Rhizophagus clarus]
MFVYNYLSNIVFSDSIEKSRKPTQPPLPQQNYYNSSSKQKRSTNTQNTQGYYYEYHKFHTYSNFHNHTSAFAAATMNSPNNNNSPNKAPQNKRVVNSEHRCKIVDDICAESNLYNILGVERTCSTEELRRAYISRSRICHPDKFPEYPKATEAFQKLSYAYETLNKPSTRRAYDISGTSELGNVNGMGDETLHGVLYQLFLEFMDGDFEMIRALVNALNENNPGLNLGDDAIETLEIAFRRMRDLLLAGKKYVKIVQFELIRLYELQQQLRSLSYFDVFGRLRITLQLARLTLTIPMLIDNAMKAEFDAGAKGANKGLLGDGVAKVIYSLVTVLERGEQYV